MILLDERQPVAPPECEHTEAEANVPRWIAVRRTTEGRCPVSGLPRVACAAADGPAL